jgi:hypothetical protein
VPKTAVLHIGTPKTGTTSIQNYLYRAECSGLLQPYRYPVMGFERHHNRLATVYLPCEKLTEHRRAEFQADPQRYQRARSQYHQFFFEALRSSEHVILSAEVLHRFEAPTILQLRRDLEAFGFEEFHIVLYVRDPADFYLSRTQLCLKTPIQYHPLISDPLTFHYQFVRFAANWEEIFPGRVIVRGFPQDPFQHDVIDDFSQLLERFLGVAMPPATVRLNTSISAEGMVILQRYRQSAGTDRSGLWIPGLDRLVAFLERSEAFCPQTRPKLIPALAASIRANHREDAESIKARYGVDLGLGCPGYVSLVAPRPRWTVEDIIESVDSETVKRLHDAYHRVRRQLLLLDLAKDAYKAIPSSIRPMRLEALLKTTYRSYLPNV